MNIKHTEGDWFISHSPTTGKLLNKRFKVGRWYKSVKNKNTIGGKIIAKASGDSKEEAEANAKLIALAPQMYKYCMKKLDLLQKQVNIRVGMDRKDMADYEELKELKELKEIKEATE